MTPLALLLDLAPKPHTSLVMWSESIFVGSLVFVIGHEIMIKFCLESNRLHDTPPPPNLCWLDFNLGNYSQLPKFQLSIYGSVFFTWPLKAVLARKDWAFLTGTGCLFLACEAMSLC